MSSAAPNATAIADLLAIFDHTPLAREVAQRAVALEGRHEHASVPIAEGCPVGIDGRCLWDGFSWHEIDVPGYELSRLTSIGLLKITYRSRAHTTYRLRDRTAAALALDGAVPEPAAVDEEPAVPADLFDVVVGLESIKELLTYCIDASAPVHALLVGPFGTAKSLLLLELSRLRDSKYLVSGNTSRAGLLELLFSDRPPRYLLIDELEKKRSAQDLAVLLSVMEDGRVTRLLSGRQEERHLILSVFAACNSTVALPRELLSRFLIIRVPEYTPAQYAEVATGFLIRREGADPELAREIAQLCAGRSHDVRDARLIFRMCKGDRRLARRLVGAA